MAFLDDLGKTITDMGKDAAQKAKEVAEVLQLKAQVSAEKAKVRDFYAVIGQLYFKNHRAEAEDQFADICVGIRNTLTNISDLEERIGKLEGSKICPSCGTVVNRDAAFCSKCGTAMSMPEEPDDDKENTDLAIGNDVI
ncbi:MAG: zinc ribbon domain-containing protein [Clostridium sp.]